MNPLFDPHSPVRSALLLALAAVCFGLAWARRVRGGGSGSACGRGGAGAGAGLLRAGTAESFALAGILVLALQARWTALRVHSGGALDPDAAGFLEIILRGGWYETAASAAPWVREPLWIWINRVAGWMAGGATAETLRVVSVVAGLLLVAQTARLGAVWMGTGIGLAAAAGVALSPRWMDWSGRGLRTDLYAALVMSFLLAWECARAEAGPRRACWAAGDPEEEDGKRGGKAGRESGWRGWWERLAGRADLRAAWALGLWATAANLTYISALSWTLPLWAWRAWRDGWGWRARGLALLLVAVPLAPHLAFNHRFEKSDGDWFFSSNIHARFYRNYEAVGQFPETREEFNRDPYGGEPVSTMGWLVGGHTAGELARGWARGAWMLYVYRAAGIEQFGASKLLTLLMVVGVAAAMAEGAAGRRSVALWLWIGWPIWYLASMRHFDFRIAAHLTPWMWMYLGCGVAVGVECARGVAGRLRCRSGRKTT